MAKGAEEMIEELEAEDLLRTPKSTRKKSRSQSLKKSPSKNAMESSAPRTPGTPATRSSASKAGQAAGTAQKKGPTGSSDSPTKTPRHSMAIFPSSSSSATGSKSTPSSATSSKSTRPSASQATPRSSEVRVKVEGAAKKKHSSMRTSFSSVSDYTWLLESTRDAVSGSISSLEAWKRARAGTKDKSSDMSSSAPSQAMDKAKAPATPTSANAVPVSSAAAPASPGAGTPAAPQTSQNPSTSSASPTSTRRAARLTRTPRPYVFLSSDLQSGSVGTVDPSSSTGTVATESSNYMSAQSTVSIEQAQATSHSAKKDPKPASGDAHQSNDADSSGLSSAPKTPPPHAHTAANDLELALALAESSSSSPLASVTSSPPAVRPSQMPTLSPLASPQLRAAEASLRRDRENSPKDSYPLREPSSDIDLVDFWAGIKHPGSQSQSSRLGSAGQTGLASSARQDKGKRVIKSEDQDHILDKDSKTRKGRRVSFKDGAGADISQPIDVDSLLVDSDGAHEPPRIKARPRSPTKKRKRAASPSVSLDGSPVRTSTPQPKRRKSRARSRLRHPSFWLLDGTVVVQVESMLFKLHRSRLVSESPYFAKLFGQRRAGEEDGDEKVEYEEEEGEEEEGERETIDSCPVYCVRHPHVTARDFEKVLAAMEDGITYIKHPPPFSDVISILRASTHLQFLKYRDWALAEVEETWGGGLEGLIAQWRGGSDFSARYEAGREAKWATKMVVVARECGLNSLLKRVFYELLRSSGLGQPDWEVMEVESKGKGTATASMSYEEHEGGNEVWELPTPLVLKMVRASQNLCGEWNRACHDSTFVCPQDLESHPTAGQLPSPSSFTPARSCPTEAEKIVAWHNVTRELSSENSSFAYDPICGLSALIEINWGQGGKGFCEECVEMRRKAWRAQRQKIWDNLGIWLSIADA